MKNQLTFKLIVLSIFAVLFVSCFSIRSKYEQVNYYLLQQVPLLVHFNEQFLTQLIVREFRISSEYDTEHLLAREKEGIRRYHYHRWLNTPSSMITDYVIARLNRHEVFSGGIHSFKTMATSDYFLEGTVNEIIAYNSDSRATLENYVVLSIQIALIKRQQLKAVDTVLFNNIYETKVIRKDNSVSNIAESVSRGLAEITDSIMADIIKAMKE